MSISSSFIIEWAKAQQPKARVSKAKSAFDRNLEDQLQIQRARQECMPLHTIPEDAVDFCSADVLSLGVSGALRAAFLVELERNPGFRVGPSGTRLMFGNTGYYETVENEVAAFHGAETALVTINGSIANTAIFSTLPRPGDAIVYDQYIHITVRDGMKDSLATVRKPFLHNDIDSFVEVLLAIRESQPLICRGERCVLVAVEGTYSMGGDVPPLQELVAAAKRIFPNGNAQFYIDEAHSTGVLGNNGAGLVSALGLENDIAIRLHTCVKALGGSGAMILCNGIVKETLLNQARSMFYSGAPSFPTMASIRAGYDLLKAGKADESRKRIPYLVDLFKRELFSNPIWPRAKAAKILSAPRLENRANDLAKDFVTPICPIMTRPNTKHNTFLAFHLQLKGFVVYAFSYPVVPRGAERVRIIMHAFHSEQEVAALASCICAWAGEMLDLDRKESGNACFPQAARQVYDMIGDGFDDLLPKSTEPSAQR